MDVDVNYIDVFTYNKEIASKIRKKIITSKENIDSINIYSRNYIEKELWKNEFIIDGKLNLYGISNVKILGIDSFFSFSFKYGFPLKVSVNYELIKKISLEEAKSIVLLNIKSGLYYISDSIVDNLPAISEIENLNDDEYYAQCKLKLINEINKSDDWNYILNIL